MEINSVFFRITLKGNGIVNFDGDSQKFTLIKKCGVQFPTNSDQKAVDSLQLGKKNFYMDEDGNVTYKPKISANCLRHEIFQVIQHSGVFRREMETCDFLSRIPVLLRGWMAKYQNDTIINHSSCIRITDAEVINGAMPELEIGSTCGDKTFNPTSLFYTETMGKTVYECLGAIDFKTLEFLSCDPIFSRMAFKEDWIKGEAPTLDIMFKNHYGRVPYKVGYFMPVETCLNETFAEHGIKFDADFVKEMIRLFFVRILNLRITRADAYAETVKVEIKRVENAFQQTLNSPDDWEEVTMDNLDSMLNFEPKTYYMELPEDKVQACKDRYAQIYQELSDAYDKRREKKAEEKKARSSKKSQE